MSSLPFTQVTDGNWVEALETVFNTVFPYGLFWIIIGLLIFAVVQTKSRSYGVSGIVMVFYFGIVSTLMPVEIQPFILLFIGILGFMLFIRAWR